MRQRCRLLLPREPKVPPVVQLFLSDRLPRSPHLPLLIPVLQDTPGQTPQVKKNCRPPPPRPLRRPRPLPRSQRKNLPAGLKQPVCNTNLSGPFLTSLGADFLLVLHSCECKEDAAFGDPEGIQDGSAESQEAGGSGTSAPLLEDQQSMYKGFIVPLLFTREPPPPNAPIGGNIVGGCWARRVSDLIIFPAIWTCLTCSRETRGGDRGVLTALVLLQSLDAAIQAAEKGEDVSLGSLPPLPGQGEQFSWALVSSVTL